MKTTYRRLLILSLSLILAFPIQLYAASSINYEEITNEIIDDCITSGDYTLTNDGKLTLTKQGKEKFDSQCSLSNQLTNIKAKILNPIITTYAYTDRNSKCGNIRKSAFSSYG